MRTSVRRSGRSRGGAFLAAACASTLLVGVGAGAGPALAQQSDSLPQENLVSLEVREARLEEVVAILTRQTGLKNIVIENEPGHAFRLVSLNISDMPLSRVLGAAARAAGAAVVAEDGIYYIRPKTAGEPARADAAPASVDPAEAALVPATRPSPGVGAANMAPASPSIPRQWVKVVLQYLKPGQFTSLVKNPEFLTVDDGPMPRMSPLQNGPHITPAPAPIQIVPTPSGNDNGGGENPASPGGFTAGHRDAPGATAAQFGGGGFRGGAGGAGGGFQGGGGGGFQPGGGGLQPGGGGQQGQGTLLPAGVDQVLAFDIDNSLLVRGTPEGLEELRSIIRLLDIPPKQVEIKAEFVEISVDDRDDFGIEWDIRPAGNIAVDLPAGAGGTISQGSLFLRIASGNAVATLRADITRSTTNLLQSPIISTINNVPASIVVSDTVPYATTSTVFNNNVAVTQSQIQFVTATNGLQVQPRINGDNSITLFLTPQLQSVQLLPLGPGGQLLPRTSQSALTTYRRIQNGETMVLGGFITKQEVVATNRTPILSDLPIIGSLFRARSRHITGSEVLVFLTPRIIEERALGTVGTGGATPAPSP